MSAIPYGPELNITRSANEDQNDSAVTTLSDGRILVVWTDESETGGDTSGRAVRGKILDPNGISYGGEFLVNTTTGDSQAGPAVAAFDDGGFVISWTDASETGADTSQNAIRAQVYTASGGKSGGEFIVNTTTATSQYGSSVATLSDDRFVVSWTDVSQSGEDISGFSVRAQIFEANGIPSGSEFVANTTTSNRQYDSTITGLGDGGFVICWRDQSASEGDTSGAAIRAQRYDEDGNAVGGEVLINTTTSADQWQPEVSETGSGGFVAVWTDASGAAGDESGTAVRAQFFGSDGSTAGLEILVNTTTASDQSQPSVCTLADGRVAICWVDASSDTSGTAIRAQMFNSDGSMSGAEFIVSQTAANLTAPAISAMNDGRFIVTWTADFGADGEEVRAHIFDPRPTAFDETPEQVGTVLGNLGFGVLALENGHMVSVYQDGGDVRAQLRSADGTLIGSDFVVATDSDQQGQTQVASLTGGGFVVTDSHYGNIRATIFDSDGIPIGSEFRVNATSRFAQDEVAVTGLVNGDFVIGWQDSEDFFPYDRSTRFQTFDASGTPLGIEFETDDSDYNTDPQDLSFASLVDGGYVMCWTEYDPADGIGDIRVWRFSGDGLQGGGQVSRLSDVGSKGFPRVCGLSDGGYVVSWTETGFGNGHGTHAQIFSATGALVGGQFFTSGGGLAGLSDGRFIIGNQVYNGDGSLSAEWLWGNSSLSVLPDGRVISGDKIIDPRITGIDLTGTDSSDAYVGSKFDDVILGLGGQDQLLGGEGNDILKGGSASDILRGGLGNDRLLGGGGNDNMAGGEGNDSYSVGQTGDIVTEAAGGGIDTVMSSNLSLDLNEFENIEKVRLLGSSNLNATGNDQNNVLLGNSGNNVLSGSDGDDRILGKQGDDNLYGGNGHDILYGDAGNDTLVGGSQRDFMTGGAGQDTFEFNSAVDTGTTFASRDLIFDFNQSESDLLDFSGVDAGSLIGDQSFTFAGTGGFSGEEGQLRYRQTVRNTIVEGDIDGDGVADFGITLTGLYTLNESDFIL